VRHGLRDSREGTHEVGRDKVGRVPLAVDEHGEFGEEEDDDDHEDTVVGEVRLTRCEVRQGAAVDLLQLGAAVEAAVGDEDAKPDEETGDARHIDEPAEDLDVEE